MNKLPGIRWLGDEFDGLVEEEPMLVKAYHFDSYPETKRNVIRSQTLSLDGQPFGTLWMSHTSIDIDHLPGGNLTYATAERLRLRVLHHQDKTVEEAFKVIQSRYKS